MSRPLVRFLVCAFVTLSVAPAQAQMFPTMSDDEPVSYRAVGVSIPAITATRETLARIDFNLSGQGSMGIEGIVKREREEVHEETQQETGESLVAQAYGIGIALSRYSSGVDMSGFYWTLGAGYREEKMNWSVSPEKNDPQADFALVNDKNKLEHKAVAKGTTGTLRVGYRYVGSTLPIIAGFYLGARHFQASVKDVEPKGDRDTAISSDSDPMTDREKERLRRRVTTAPDAGIELGFAF